MNDDSCHMALYLVIHNKLLWSAAEGNEHHHTMTSREYSCLSYSEHHEVPGMESEMSIV